MEKYSDLITNGLDLISFLLVTPEILNVVAPAATLLIVFLMLGIFLLLLILVIFLPFFLHLLLGYQLHAWFGWEPPSWITTVACAAMVTVVSVAVFAERPIQRLYSEKWFRWAVVASKHLFRLGVVLFFISRVIAFYGSAVKSGLL